MERRLFKVRGCIAVIIAILLSLCLALGFAFAVSPAVYADETVTEENGKPVKQANEWVSRPAFVELIDGEDEDKQPVKVESEVHGWVEGKFNADAYYIKAEAKYGEKLYFAICKDARTPVVFGRETVNDSEGKPVQRDKTVFELGTDGEITEDVIAVLNGLEAGNYYLLGIVPADADGAYSGLNYGKLTKDDIIADGCLFTVSFEETAENEWVKNAKFTVTVDKQEVVLDEWKQGTFHGDEYVITAEAKHGGIYEMYFRIYTAGEELVPVEFTDGTFIHGEKDYTAFNVDDEGRVPAFVTEKINLLGEGNYYLFAVVPDDVYVNYEGLNGGDLPDEEIIKRSFAFSITAVPDAVEITLTGLSVAEWTLGDFVAEKNLIKVETNALAEDVYLTVYRDNNGVKGSAVVNLSEFKIASNGTVVDRVAIEALNLLGAGKYWLTASVTNANGEVLTQATAFNVRMQNYWVDVPSLTNWTEGQFDIKANTLRGSSRVGEITFTIYDGADNLLYTVVKKEDGSIASVTDANGDGSLHIKVLNKLPIGTYKLVASVESTDRYSELETTAYFSVQEDSVALGGIIVATVCFAVVDLIAAGLCIALLIIRRRRVEAQFHKMVNKELHRG